MVNDPLVEALYESLREWAEKEKAHNPSFSLVYGRKSFSIDEIVEHIEKDTEEGRELMKMMFSATIKIFSDYKPG